MPATREELLAAATSLCTAFATGASPSTLLTHFSTTPAPSALEHGQPCLAPFLGRPFVGRSAVEQYFQLLVECLRFENMVFAEYMVDAEAMKVCVKGAARFTWNETGHSWDEVFVYVLDFCEERAEAEAEGMGDAGEGNADKRVKVCRYQVWADSGAAYLARMGMLKEVANLHR